MRNHLYKGRRKDTGEWIRGHLIYGSGQGKRGQAYICPSFGAALVEVDPGTVSECVGGE